MATFQHATLLSPDTPAAARLVRGLPFVLVIAAAFALRRTVIANVDVSWMLTLCEKILNGQRLYVDLIELNPPGGILLYLPPVLVARLFGLTPESVTDVFVIAAACASIWFIGRVFDVREFLKVDGWHLAALTAAVLTVLPGHAFGDRDPLALIALLPWLAVCGVRAMRRPVARKHAVIAGVCAALAVIIKPHMVLAMLVTALATAACAKSWRVVPALENFLAAALVVAYVAAVALAFPAFISDTLPMVAAVYVARPLSVLDMLPALGLWLIIVAMIFDLRRRAAFAPPFCILLAASFGCALVFLLQGKGFPYHSFPMLALALIALAIAGNWFALSEAGVATGKRRGWFVRIVVAGAVVGVCFCWFNRATDISPYAEKVARLAPRPSMLAITSEVALGHPLVREVGGVWIGRSSNTWITNGVLLRRRFETLDAATAARLDAYESLERAMVADDIARGRPDIILVERIYFDWQAWARADPRLRELLDDYHEADTLNGIIFLQRRPL